MIYCRFYLFRITKYALRDTNYISDQSPRYNNVIPLYFTKNSDTKNNFNYKQNINVTDPQNPLRAHVLRHFISLMKKAWLTVQADRKFYWIWTVSKKIQASEQQRKVL